MDPPRHCEPTGRANARPMTGSTNQSILRRSKCGLLRRFVPRNDGWSTPLSNGTCRMNPATKSSNADQPAAHLRLVSNRAAGGTAGIQLSRVSKTYPPPDREVPLLPPLDFHIHTVEL